MSRTRSLRRPRTAALLSAALLLSSGALVAGPATEPAMGAPPEVPVFSDGERMETYSAERPVAPGVTLTSFDSYGPDQLTGKAGWLQGSLLTADLTGDVRLERIFPGEVAKREQLTTQANRAGAIAAVNASYFDISSSGAPWGAAVQDGQLLQSPHLDDPRGACPECSVMVTEEGIAQVGEILFEGTIKLPDGSTVRLDELNKPRFQISDGIMAYTPVWGTYRRSISPEPTDRRIEVVVADGKVSSVSPTPGEGQLPEGSFTLVGRGTGVDSLAGLSVGDPVSIEYDFRSADDQRIRAAASGRQILVAEGVPQQPRVNSSDPQPHPRTAIGFSKDGGRMFMLTVDGRQPEFSDGVSLDELAEMLVDLGAYSAVNFDGGGSTTLVARKPGSDQVELVNRPSEFDDDEIRPGEFTQRPVPDGLGLFIPEGSGRLDGFWLETKADPIRAVGPNFAPRLRTDRVFPGLTRALTAAPHDEMYSPASLAEGRQPTWSASDPKIGIVDQSGVFTGKARGTTTVTAASGAAAGELTLTVLDELARIRPSTPLIDLSAGDDTPAFDVIGYDAQGYTAPIDPADVGLRYDEAALDIKITDGRFVITGKSFEGTREVELTVDGSTTTLTVVAEQEVELEEVVVEDFETIDRWDPWTLRATGEWTSTPDGVTGKAGRLDYDFTQDTATRGIGIWPADGFFPLEGTPTELKLRVNADPVGLRARIEIMDARGVLRTVEPGFVDQPGWQVIRYPVPAEVSYPIKLRRIYFNEIRPTAGYRGTTLLDELVAVRPVIRDVEQPRPVPDPIVSYGTERPLGPWQFGVVSQVGVSAEDPEGAAVQEARRVLREARRRGADPVIINGGLVATGSAANFALAKRILDTELDGIDYHYVPGAAELDADGSLRAFENVFGPAQRVVDHRDVRFLILDTTRRSYQDSDWRQLPLIHEQLTEAAGSSKIKSVVLVQSQPLRDEVPPAEDQLSDPKEAATVEEWLTEFRGGSGKNAMIIGGEEATFGALRVDGIPQLTNGSGSPTLASGAPHGGFAGWSLIQVGARTGPDGFSTEFVPQVDKLIMTGPGRIAAGSTASISTVITQGATSVEVRYPMGAVWSGTGGVYVGTVEQAGAAGGDYRAVFDPATAQLTALKSGTISLRVKINGQTAAVKIDITA